MKHIQQKACTNFNPAIYNSPDVVAHINCYAYALDEPGLGFPWLGYMRFRNYARHFPEDMERLIVANTVYRRRRLGTLCSEWEKADALLHVDGLERVSPPKILPDGNNHTIALIPFYHNHFYRLDSNGIWSHKPSMLDAINTDKEGAKLTDLNEQIVLGLIEKLKSEWETGFNDRDKLEEQIENYESGNGIHYYRIPAQGIHAYLDDDLLLKTAEKLSYECTT